MTYYVYMMTNRRDGTLYAGVTNDLSKRVNQHRLDRSNSFVSRYKLFIMVWAREFSDVEEAIAFEKRLKRWRRSWKVQLIEEANPNWESVV